MLTRLLLKKAAAFAAAAILLFSLLPAAVSHAAQQSFDLRSLQWWAQDIGPDAAINGLVAVVDTGCSPELDPTGSLNRNIVGGWNAVDNTSDYSDANSAHHGTHMAGLIASHLGVVTHAPLLIVRAAVPLPNGEVGIGTLAASRGIVWAVDHGAQVICCAFGFFDSQQMADAVNYAQQQGVLVVAAAGNDHLNKDEVPDGWEQLTNYNALRVAASIEDGTLAPDSAWGHTSVELAVQTEGILLVESTPTNFVSAFPGTSDAAAIATATAGLLRNELLWDHVIPRLCQSAQRRPELANKLWSGGTLDLGRALRGEVNLPLDRMSARVEMVSRKKVQISGSNVPADPSAPLPRPIAIRVWANGRLLDSSEVQDIEWDIKLKFKKKGLTDFLLQSSGGSEVRQTL